MASITFRPAVVNLQIKLRTLCINVDPRLYKVAQMEHPVHFAEI